MSYSKAIKAIKRLDQSDFVVSGFMSPMTLMIIRITLKKNMDLKGTKKVVNKKNKTVKLPKSDLRKDTLQKLHCNEVYELANKEVTENTVAAFAPF